MEHAPNFEASQTHWSSRRFMFFRGQFDSNIKTGADYDTQVLNKLWTMRPGNKAKGEGLALIPSTYCDYDAREHAAQREHGKYIALTGDVDAGDHDLATIRNAITDLVGDAGWLIYASAHARPGDMRWRIILPLDQVQPFDAWYDAQLAFFAYMEARGIAMDHAMARAAQPVYLPNVPAIHEKTGTPLRGEDGQPLYFARAGSDLTAPGLVLDGGLLAQGIARIRHQRIEDEKARDRIRQEAEAKRANKPRTDGASLIEDFNATNTVANMLELCGYEQSPRNADDWRSPKQQGETYATRVIGEKWISLSASDASAGIGERCKSGCYGDAYDLFVFFKHNGDHKAAFRALHAERRASQPNVIYLDPPEWVREVPPYDEMPDWAHRDEEDPDILPDIEASFAEPETDRSTFEFLTLSQLRNLPPPSWLVHEAIVSDGLSIIYGEPGAGKSFIALDMALRIALGWEWHGVTTKQTGVLYIAGEGVRGIGKRVDGWALKHGIDLDGAPFVVMTVAAQLLEPDDRAKLIRTIDEAKRQLGFDVGLIVVDTVSRSLAGADENGQETMSAFVKACDDIKAHTGGALIGIHHSGKDKDRGMRGSTVLLGACDASIRLTKSDKLVTLAFEKQKDAEQGDPIYFQLDKHVWQSSQHGEELSTLVPVRSKANEAEGTLTMDQVRNAFAALADAWADGRPLSHKPQTRSDGRYAPQILAKRFGGAADAWVSMIASWLENGVLSFEMYDHKSKSRGLQVLRPVGV